MSSPAETRLTVYRRFKVLVSSRSFSRKFFLKRSLLSDFPYTVGVDRAFCIRGLASKIRAKNPNVDEQMCTRSFRVFFVFSCFIVFPVSRRCRDARLAPS